MIRSATVIKPGRHEIGFVFTFEGQEPGGPGTGRLLVDGWVVAEGILARTPRIFQISETFSVGQDPNTPVTDAYPALHNAFNGEIEVLSLRVGEGPGISAGRAGAAEPEPFSEGRAAAVPHRKSIRSTYELLSSLCVLLTNSMSTLTLSRRANS